MVEEDWLKMLSKRKFRELKIADEEKASLEKTFSKSTDVSNCSFSSRCTVAECKAEQTSS